MYESSSDGGRFTTSEESGITIEEYVPHDPVPFRSGDVLGCTNLVMILIVD